MPEEVRSPGRVFISYAHGDAAHEDQVREFWLFLRTHGIDARADLLGTEHRANWLEWMIRQIREAQHVLIIASPSYRQRADATAEFDRSHGVRWQSRWLRQRFQANVASGSPQVIPVILPGCSAAELPGWLRHTSTEHYLVSENTTAGASALLRLLNGGRLALPGISARPALHTEVLLEVKTDSQGQIASTVSVADSQVYQGIAGLPDQLTHIWQALRLPPLDAAQRLAEAGRQLTRTLMDDSTQRVLAAVIDKPSGDDTIEFILNANGPALSLPVELIRLQNGEEDETASLGLLPAVSVSRRLTNFNNEEAPNPAPPAGLPGPLKVLVAVAAPNETTTPNVPLDVEAEMQAVLDALTDVLGHEHAQARILEVASLSAIQQALQVDAYHVLHLSAHGSPTMVELEDEDGNAVAVTAESLINALRHSGRPVPLIMLSSCSGGSSDTQAIAASLVQQGADRVIAMLAPVTDGYATILARHLYREMVARPESTVGQALARARRRAEDERSQTAGERLPPPEYGVATLFMASNDVPLIDQAAPAAPLPVMTVQPGSGSIRDLPMGALIGRRAQLRAVMGVLRRTAAAVEQYGTANGVVLTGIGGIGKTALAGRVISRLRDDGWLIAIHDGLWNPAELINVTAAAIAEGLARPGIDAARGRYLREVLARLADRDSDDGPKLAAIANLLAGQRLLLVFDDFEQNLTTGGRTFLDPALDELITALADAARTGALLVTCRYPLPGPDRFLIPVPIPPLSAAEQRRLFLRLPALADLDPADKSLVTRTVGGHPRLIQFTDALLRGGRSSLKHVQTKLQDLTRSVGISPRPGQQLPEALDQAMILGKADVLLDELVGLLTPLQHAILLQSAVSPAPMTLEDLEFTLTPVHEQAALNADVERLMELTLLIHGEDITMHPWTAEIVMHKAPADLDSLHERALAMRERRLQQQRGSYEDLVDIPRHLGHFRRYDEIARLAEQVTTSVLPGTLAAVSYLAAICPFIPPRERAWIVVTDLAAAARLRAGDLPWAFRELQAVHQQALARAETDSSNTDWQRDLSVTHERLGDVAITAGDSATARDHYQASLEITVRLAAMDPSRDEWQRDLSVSHNKLGDLAVATGDLHVARRHYEESLDIRGRLAAANPGNAELQRDVSLSLRNLGSIEAAAGDLSGAWRFYEESLAIATRLVAADQTNIEWRRELLVSLDKLGDLAVAGGDLIAARDRYERGLDIALQLAAADPANTEWHRDVAVSHNKLGDVAFTTKDLAIATIHYQAGLDIALQLAAADPANIGWQRDLSISHERLGDIATATGDLGAATRRYQTSLEIRSRLVATDQTNTSWQRDLSIGYERLGDVAAASGDLSAAADHYHASLDIAQQLAHADPANAAWQHDLSVGHDKLGDIAAAAGDRAAARSHFQIGLEIAQRLAAADPANVEWQSALEMRRRRMTDLEEM